MQPRTSDSIKENGRRTAILLGLFLLAAGGAILVLREWNPEKEPAPSPPEASSLERPSGRSPGDGGAQSSPEGGPGSEASLLDPLPGDEDAPATLVVRVLDASTQQPLSRERVDALLRGSDLLRPAALTTDEDGIFVLEAVPPGAYTLQTRHADFLPDVRQVQAPPPSTFPEGQSRRPDLEVSLVPGEALAGEVVDKEGRPLPGSAVKMMLVEGDSLDNVTARTAADGSFLMHGLRHGKWRLAAGKDGYRRASLSVEIPSPGSVRVELPEDRGFAVMVSDEEGAPVVAAQVRVLQRTDGLPGGRSLVRTDSAGQATLHGLPANPELSVLLEVVHEAYLPAREKIRVADLESGPYHLRLSGGRVVAGKVVDSGGAPVRGAEVRLVERGKTEGRTLKTISTGEFRFNRVLPGEYDLAAVTREQGAGRASIQVGGPVSTNGLEIVLEAGAGEVAGRVMHRDGKPVRLCPVELRLGPGTAADPSTTAARGSLVLKAMTGADGSFRFAGLTPPAGAVCTITAGGGKYTTARNVTSRIGEKGVEIVVEPLGAIRGNFSPEGQAGSFSIVLGSEEASRGAWGERRFHFASHDGWFRLRRIPPGRYTVSVEIEGKVRATARGVEVIPGQETGPVMMRAGE